MNSIDEDLSDVCEQYTPDGEELSDAVGFLMNCSESDLVQSWSKISTEWDLDSITRVHKTLCNTGRIHALIEGFLKV